MAPTTPARRAELEHPQLAGALTRLARCLDPDPPEGSGDDPLDYLRMIALVTREVRPSLDDFTRILVHAARRHSGASWADVAAAAGVSRATAYGWWRDPSPNDVAGPDDASR